MLLQLMTNIYTHHSCVYPHSHQQLLQLMIPLTTSNRWLLRTPKCVPDLVFNRSHCSHRPPVYSL